MIDIYLFLIYSVALIGVMLVAELAYRFLHMPTEWSRKIAHVGAGITALTYPKYIDNHWIVLALTLSFTLILFISKKLKLFPSIFAVERKSSGELFFVWSTWLLFLLYITTGNKIYYYLPFAIVVFADPAAALIGQSFPIKHYTIKGHQKSLGGSITFFIFSLFLTLFIIPAIDLDSIKTILFAIFFSIILTMVEAFSFRGVDNISIPLVAIILLKLYFGFL